MIQAANLLPADGEAYFYPSLFTEAESDRFFITLQQEIAWRQEPVVILGRQIMQPRLTAWYGDTGKTYRYTGLTMHPLPWTAALSVVKARIEDICGHSFNSALLNFYRDGRDSMGWHRDNEKELGNHPVIASVSFGTARRFCFRHKDHKASKETIFLSHGSLLLMKGSTQHNWYHSIPKALKVTTGRINITFRNIIA
jgi:alkylated DNA repair dioxygenase AlkB